MKQLIHASIHAIQTQDGGEIEYARLMYRTDTGILGQSLMTQRLSPATFCLARLGYSAD